MANRTGLQLGTTLFSFTNEFHGRQYTFDELVGKIAEYNLGPGVEIVGFSHIRGYPHVNFEFAEHFRILLAKLGLVA